MGKSRQKTRRNTRSQEANEDVQHTGDDNNQSTNQNISDNHTIDDDSTDTEDVQVLNHNKCKPKLQVFKGNGDKISIENWLKRYEMIAGHQEWSEKDKNVMLGNYLEDDALNWFIENCSDSYDDVKLKLINRFGVETVDPIIEFISIRYDIKLGIKDYFERKRRFGNLAKLSVEQMIPLLIHNLHPKMAENFVAVKPKTLTEFYNIAQSAESNLKRFINRSTTGHEKPKPNFEPKQNQTKRKPPNPCRICENLGYKNRFHWGNECRNKGKTESQKTFQQNSVKVIEHNNESEENNINNIEI